MNLNYNPLTIYRCEACGKEANGLTLRINTPKCCIVPSYKEKQTLQEQQQELELIVDQIWYVKLPTEQALRKFPIVALTNKTVLLGDDRGIGGYRFKREDVEFVELANPESNNIEFKDASTCWLTEGCNGKMAHTLTVSICQKCGETSET